MDSNLQSHFGLFYACDGYLSTTQEAVKLLLLRCLLTVFLLFFASNGWATIYVTGGSFTYQVESSAELLFYQVKAVRYHGVAAWHMHWHSSQLDADHFIRRDSGAPIFVHRVLHALQQVVEIAYDQGAAGGARYRFYAKGKLVKEKWINNHHLVDLATLPQMLRHAIASPTTSPLHDIQVINYSDGNLYSLKISRVGVSQFAIDGRMLSSIRYRVEVDSWLSMFAQAIEMDIPLHAGFADLAAYSGPDFMGSRDQLTLHLLTAVAAKGG